MDDTKIEGVGVPVPASVVVESLTATSNSPEDRIEALRRVHVFADLPSSHRVLTRSVRAELISCWM